MFDEHLFTDAEKDVYREVGNVSGVCEKFQRYVPFNDLNGIGYHPQTLCEGSGVACVQRPLVPYKLLMEDGWHTPNEENEQRPHISWAQKDAIALACNSFAKEYRDEHGVSVTQGFFLGDGTGVGKTRTIAGIIKEQRLNGLPLTVWITSSTDLIEQIRVECQYFEEDLRVFEFTTIDNAKNKWMHMFDGVAVLTYYCLAKSKTQNTLLEYLEMYNNIAYSRRPKPFDGLVILDEAHKAKSLRGRHASKCALFIEQLHKRFPRAKVIYSTATVASKPAHMIYLKRLGIWGRDKCFADPEDFISKLDELGVAGLEAVACDMKRRGVSISRHISYDGVVITCQEVAADPYYLEMHRRCCDLFGLMLVKLEEMGKREQEANKQIKGKKWKPLFHKVCTFYWLSLSFFQSVVSSSKIKEIVQRIGADLALDRSIIVGLQKTGHSGFLRFVQDRFNRHQPYSNAAGMLRIIMHLCGVPLGCPKTYLQDGSMFKIGEWTEEDERMTITEEIDERIDLELDDLWEYCVRRNEDENLDLAFIHSEPSHLTLSTAGGRSHFGRGKRPKLDTGPLRFGEFAVGSFIEGLDASKITWSIREVADDMTDEGLARLYHELHPFLPVNPLDELVSRIIQLDGITEDLIANCTGRSQFYLPDSPFSWKISPKSTTKLTEMNSFMDLEKRIAIISAAASVGFSLHADPTKRNTQKRTHITLELPWSSEEFVQQLGRSHRSSQIHAPEYVIFQSPFPGEARFLAIVAHRLTMLDAVCHGQSQANPCTDVMPSELCNNLAFKAIQRIGEEKKRDAKFKLIWDPIKRAFSPAASAHPYLKTIPDRIGRFFNRILMSDIEMQTEIVESLNKYILEFKQQGEQIHQPIIEYPLRGSDVDITLVMGSETFVLPNSNGVVFIYKFEVNRILTWKALQQLVKCKAVTYRRDFPAGATAIVDTGAEQVEVYQPFSKTPVLRGRRTLGNYGKEVDSSSAHYAWNDLVSNFEKKMCIHAATMRPCKRKGAGCTLNAGRYDMYLLGGAVLDVLYKLRTYLPVPIQMAKVTAMTLEEYVSFFGVTLPNSDVETIRLSLREICNNKST